MNEEPSVREASFVAIATLVALATVLLLPPSIPRTAAGGFLALIAPGHALVLRWTRDRPWHLSERFAVGVAVSIILTSVAGFALSRTALGIAPVPLAILLSMLTLALLGTHLREAWPSGRWPEARDLVPRPLVMGSVLLLASAGGFAYLATIPPPQEEFVELYFADLPLDAQAHVRIAPDEPLHLRVVARSHHDEPVAYQMVTLMGDAPATQQQVEQSLVVLGAGETWTNHVTLHPPRGLHRVAVELHDAQGRHAPQSIHVWVQVG